MAETKTRRPCRESECDTILSQYNPRDHCSLHERENPPSNVDGTWTGRLNTDGKAPLAITWRAGEFIVECPVCQRASGGRKSLRHHIARQHGRRVTYIEDDDAK